jgi:hypothetical protein
LKLRLFHWGTPTADARYGQTLGLYVGQPNNVIQVDCATFERLSASSALDFARCPATVSGMSAAKAEVVETIKRGLSQDEMERDLATREILRKKAVARVLASGGKLPDLPTNKEIEGR